MYSRLSLLISSIKKKNSTFVSYKKPLSELCGIIFPESILEFGPGLSTEIFIQHTNASIISIELNEKWYRKYKNAFPKNRVRILFLLEGLHSLPEEPLFQGYSLIFIDGGNRIEALEYGYEALSDKGVVYLHDAHREEYEIGIRRYPYIFFPERHSCILSKDQEINNIIKRRIYPDYSCSCQYCSSPARRAYFECYSEKLP